MRKNLFAFKLKKPAFFFILFFFIKPCIGSAQTWTGLISTDWNDADNWNSGTIPTTASNVIIPVTTNQPYIKTADAVANSITLVNSKLTMQSGYNLTISSGGFFEKNGGTLNATTSTGAVIFAGTNIIRGTSSSAFNNITINGPLTLTTAPTINGNFTINSGAISGNAPTYTSSSTLIYNITGTYTTGFEWYGGGTTTTSLGAGIPQNVIVQHGAITVVSTGPASNRSLTGDLTINSGSSFP